MSADDLSPTLLDRAEQPYVGIRREVTMNELAEVAAEGDVVAGWLRARGQQPAGPPFFKYDEVDMDRRLVVEVGFPVAAPLEGDDTVVSGVLPAGRYATLTHRGHPDQLEQATARLLAWGEQLGLHWDRRTSPGGEHWRCRLEIYLSDPEVEPDLDRWETQLAFKLAG